MAKIEFNDHSFIECHKSDNPGKVIIVISARDSTDKMKKIINAVEITDEEMKKLIGDVL